MTKTKFLIAALILAFTASAMAQDDGRTGSGSSSGSGSAGSKDDKSSKDGTGSKDDSSSKDGSGSKEDNSSKDGSGSKDDGSSKDGSETKDGSEGKNGSSDNEQYTTGSDGIRRPKGQRRFRYRAIDYIDADFSKSGDVDLTVRTRVIVNSFLYIVGNLGAEWVVDGWGSGVDRRTETVMIYHTDTLTLDFEQFGDPQKLSGTKTGAQKIGLQMQVNLLNHQTSASLFSSGLVAANLLNTIFTPAGPNFGAKATDGLIRLDMTRQISITPAVGPGVYENQGIIKVIRN